MEGFMPEANSHPNFIVLDSTVLIADYWLRSPSFVLLRDFLTKTETRLVVPLVVFQEVTNHHAEDMKTAESNLRRGQREIARLLLRFSPKEDYFSLIKCAQDESPYEAFLTNELTQLGALIADYSDIPHKDVVSRDLRRQRPFQQSGKGYRDTLLWETVLRNCVKPDSVTVLVTQNKKDFCDSGGSSPHLDLRLDIAKHAGFKCHLEIYKDLPEFTDARVVPFLKTRKDFAILIENKKFAGLDLENIMEQKIELIMEAVNNSPSCMIGDPDTHEPEVDVIENMHDIRVIEVSEITGDVLLVICEFQAEVAFAYFLSYSEFAVMTDEEATAIAILDSNWNEHVMRVGSSTEVHFRCRLTFNMETLEEESFEVEHVK
jgi:PIN domain